MEIFRSVTPLVEPLSLDEAFLDVSGAVRRLGPPAAIGQLIRDRVADEQQITCSVGVAATKFVAKLASGRAKPDGLLVVPRDETVPFLHRLPVGALWGVGERTEEVRSSGSACAPSPTSRTPRSRPSRRAARRGRRHPPARAVLGAGPAPGRPGAASRRASAPRRPSPATSTTRTSCSASCCGCPSGSRPGCAPQGVVGRTVVLKVRFADFTTITRSRTLPERTDVARSVYAVARDLYAALGLDRARLRLVGVRVEGLVAAVERPPPARARRATAGLAGGGAGRRPGKRPLRRRRRPAREPRLRRGRCGAVASRHVLVTCHEAVSPGRRTVTKTPRTGTEEPFAPPGRHQVATPGCRVILGSGFARRGPDLF